ncbi:hypothetical protein ACQB60_10135 [Actinomycetota bacterium Odt1-20B]
MTPYYLTVSYTNTGKTEMSQPDLISDFSVAGANGQAGKQLALQNQGGLASRDVPLPCDGPPIRALAPGDTAEVCQTFMLPKEATPASVSYTGDDSGTLLWQVAKGKKGKGGSDGDTSEVSDGVLPAHKSADSVWTDSKSRPVAVRATPKSVRAGAITDLGHFDLDEDQKKLVPYYVTIDFRNTGKHDLLPQMPDGVVLNTAGGQPVQKMMLLSVGGPGVAQCPEAVPDKMVVPKRSVTLCSVFMLPKGDRPASITYKGDTLDAPTITWRVTVNRR